MSDIERVLKAIVDSNEANERRYKETNEASEKRHGETKAVVQKVANEQAKTNLRLDKLESVVATHDKRIDLATGGVRQNSESDATLASNLAAVATATAATATEMRGVQDRLVRVESAVIAVPAATATATATAAALATKGENDKLSQKISLSPYWQATAVFVGTALAAGIVQLIKSLMGGH